MATRGADIDSTARLRRRRKVRVVVLVAVLCGLLACYVVASFLGNPLDALDPERNLGEFRPQDAAVPTKDQILKYLDGKTILPAGIDEGHDREQPLIFERERIESFETTRGDRFYTEVNFAIATERGRRVVILRVDHHPNEDAFVFEGIHVVSVSGR